ncbi:MAG TPA: hypothetical protein VLK33_19670 [Terriglobales bacterium]|nr:hypothetical protein [Terriglobales bacterium]
MPSNQPDSNVLKAASDQHPEQSIYVTLWLVVSAIIAIGGAILFFNEADLASGRDVREFVAILLIGSLTLGTLYCLWRMWKWQQWGVLGFVFLSLILPLYKDTFLTATPLSFIVPILQIVVLYFVIKDTWKYYEH